MYLRFCVLRIPPPHPGFHIWLFLILQGVIVSKTLTKWPIPSYHHNAVFILTTSFSFCNFIYICLSLLAVLRTETGFAFTAPCTSKYLNACLSIEWWVYLKGQSGDEQTYTLGKESYSFIHTLKMYCLLIMLGSKLCVQDHRGKFEIVFLFWRGL